MMNANICAQCGADYSADMPKAGASGASGYATTDSGERICYDCSANIERDAMSRTGLAGLYVAGDDSPYRDLGRNGTRYRVCAGDELRVTDWPGRLVFGVHEYSIGRHNIAGRRLDVWFDGPDGFVWHGVNLGDMQLTRCKRTKQRSVAYCVSTS